MPYWTSEQESKLRQMASQGKSLEELAESFDRTVEAVRLKLKRLGLDIPLPSIKVTSTTTTPPQPVKPAEHLIDFEGAMRFLLGAMKRLNKRNVSPEEVKKLRLLISTAKAYALLLARYSDTYGEELTDNLTDKLNEPEESSETDLEEKVAKLKDILKSATT